ncbi:hypothetical protein M0R19_04495 [Candidatus Pacearchaeota archaeon]|jgi:hypothetical protein|nr:hypothetical protein [Candidatus Pacearchaeota archaeon]
MSTGVSTLGLGELWSDFEFFWSDEFTVNKIAMRATLTIDGGTSIQVSDISSIAIPYTFQGHMYYSMVNSLKALSEDVGATYACTFREKDMGTVMFNSVDGAAVTFQPAYAIASPASDDVFVGTIRLIRL